MPTAKTSSRDKLLKQLMIPLLGLVLVYVVWDNFGGSVSEGTPAVATDDSQDAAKTAKAEPEVRIWQPLSADQIAATNPFGTPPPPAVVEETPAVSAPDATTAGNEAAVTRADADAAAIAEIQTLLAQPVQAWMRSGDRVAALIGNRVIREGDVLAGVVRVVQLDPDGMVVELLDRSAR